MKKTILIFTSILFVSVGFLQAESVVKVGETCPSESAYVFGSGEQLSGQQFQTNGIMTYKNYQYTVYYNLSRNVCIARRKMPVGNWEEVVLPYRNTKDDAHNVIVMGICPNDGTIHLAYDHHNDPLHYCYSIAGSANDPEHMPWLADSFSATTNLMDTAVPDVTYPRFIAKPDGNMLFECRFHYSGHGDSYLREYDAATKKWTLIGRYVQGMDVTPDACAYINGITYDNQDKLHITWCWRDDYGGGSNHDFYYAYSEDHGRTWKNTYNEQVAQTQYMLPVVNKEFGGCLSQTLKEKIMIEEIKFNRGYINQETQDVDSKGRIHAVNSHIPDGQGTDSNWGSSRIKARLHHRFRNADGSWTKRLITCNGNSINSTRRVHLAFDSFDNAYIAANGAGLFMASPNDDYVNWTQLSEDGKTAYYSEPLIDRSLLKEKGVVSFVYLSADKKIVVFDYLTKNPNTPSGNGLKAEYFSDDNFKTLITSVVVEDPSESVIPVGTKSIRWSGTFETLLGEEYTLYVNTNGKSDIYVNDHLVKITEENSGEVNFKYNQIASHKNNIVIESKTTLPITLSWSNNTTAKEIIPSTSLYSNKTNDKPGEVTPPILKEKVELNELLLGKKDFITTKKSVFNITPFDPSREYSLEIKTKINAVEGRGLDIDARAKNGKGFRVSLDKTSINITNPLSNPTQMAAVDNSVEQVYRFAIKDENVHIYRNKEYIGSSTLSYVKNIQSDDEEAESAAKYDKDIIPIWSGIGRPIEYGWTVAGTVPTWDVANGNTVGAVRYMDVSETSTPKHSYNGSTYTGRLLTLRWDGSLASTIYCLPVTLDSNTDYEFSMLYEHWNNGAMGVPITVGISKEINAPGIYESGIFPTDAAAKNSLKKLNFLFTSKDAGQYYITFTGVKGAMYAIGELKLRSFAYENRLLVGKNYNDGSLDCNLSYVSYQNGAFAASDVDSPIELPNLPQKLTLPKQVQGYTILGNSNDNKEIKTLDFNPMGDYSVEVSANISATTGRGLDLEVRSGDDKGFRTALSNTSFRWISPFSENYQLEKVNDSKQVIRYAVMNGNVHVYRNESYVNSFDVATIGTMNKTGNAEVYTQLVKPENLYDGINLIDNPDFKNDAHNAIPKGWLSDKTLGGSPNPRIQEKSQTTELGSYPDGKKAFVIRYDGNGGTYYSFPVTLKTNTWYEYTFDLITWGENPNKEFDVTIATTQDASSGVIYTQTVKTPAIRAAVDRQSIRFHTQPDATIFPITYYLVFKKIGDTGTIGITDLYLYENNSSQLLFGKNYVDGSANIQIDYISVDYSGAFAPGNASSLSQTEKDNEIIVSYVGNNLTIHSNDIMHTVSIYDVLGKRQLYKVVQNNHFSTQLPKGTYIFNINNIENKFIRKKILLN